jgi:hypothetical protein
MMEAVSHGFCVGRRWWRDAFLLGVFTFNNRMEINMTKINKITGGASLLLVCSAGKIVVTTLF